nr:anthranilate synthase [Helicobacter pylori]
MNLSRRIFLATHKKDNGTKCCTNNLNNAQKFNLIKVFFAFLIKISHSLIN